MKDCVIPAIVLKTNCTLLLPVRWIAPKELFCMIRLLENSLNLTNWLMWKSSCSYSLLKMLKCSPGLGNFCINHLEPNHPNETNTYYESFSEIHVKTEEFSTWRPQGHGRLWWLPAWQPSTPMVTAVAALNTADVSPKYLSGPWHRAIGCVEMYH